MGYRAYPEYKESGVEWLSVIPKHWEVRRLKFMATIQNGCDYKAVESDDGFPVIGSGGQFTSASEFLYDGESVLFGRKGTIDKPLHISGKFWTVDTMFYSIIHPDVFGLYLYYFSTIFQYERLATQTALPSITQHDLGNYLLCYPCFHEQQSIACFLDYKTAQIDRLIEKKQELIEKLQEQRIATITQAVTKGLDTSAPCKSSYVEWMGEVPAHWDVCKLSFRYSVDLGKMLDEKRITGDHLVPYLRNQDVQWGEINTENLPEMDIHPQEETRFTVKAGDLLVCEGGDIGRAAIWRHDNMSLGFQKALHRLRPYSQENDTTDFFYFSLIAAKYRGAFDESDTRATIAHLPADKFRQFRFAFPPLSEQILITQHLKAKTARLDAMQMNNQNAIARLQEYRTALITAAVTGQIDVRNWQAPEPIQESAANKEVA